MCRKTQVYVRMNYEQPFIKKLKGLDLFCIFSVVVMVSVYIKCHIFNTHTPTHTKNVSGSINLCYSRGSQLYWPIRKLPQTGLSNEVNFK